MSENPPHRDAEPVTLRFPGAGAKMLGNCSAVARSGATLFVAADEGVAVDRLTQSADGWTRDATTALGDLLPLAWPDDEADVEGLAVDGDWLWVVGSHARTRAKAEKAPDETIALAALARLRPARARCLLARLPLVAGTPVRRDGERRAGMLKQRRHGNALYRRLRHDPLLARFTAIPAKEGGIDIEGIAVAGERVALGLRGPVLGGHAVLLECTAVADRSGRLRIGRTLVTRLLALDGLGIRDLERDGDDLLILAGPTAGLSGPCRLYRWRGWLGDPPRDARQVRLHRPEAVMDVPFGRGVDHAEGLVRWEDGRDGAPRVLVVYDSPAARRIDVPAGTLVADVFAIA